MENRREHSFSFLHAEKIYYTGIILLLLLFPLIFIFIAYTMFSFNIVLFFFMYVPMSIFIIVSGSAYMNLRNIYKFLKEQYTLTAFNPVTYKMKVKDDTGKDYVIAYHVSCSPYSLWIYLDYFIFFTWDIPPEHYHLWTTIPDPSLIIRPTRYAFLKYIRPSGLSRIFSMTKSASQREYVFNEELWEIAPQLHPRAKNISTLRYIGLAHERGSPIILALATQKASLSDIAKILDVLKGISAEYEK